jgi:hypothetical protein
MAASGTQAMVEIRGVPVPQPVQVDTLAEVSLRRDTGEHARA